MSTRAVCKQARNTFRPNSAVTVAGGGTLDLYGFNQTVSGPTIVVSSMSASVISLAGFATGD